MGKGKLTIGTAISTTLILRQQQQHSQALFQVFHIFMVIIVITLVVFPPLDDNGRTGAEAVVR